MPSLRETLSRTRNSVFSRIQSALDRSAISDDTWEELEMLLVQADVGAATTNALVSRLRERAQRNGIVNPVKLREALKDELKALLIAPKALPHEASRRMLEVIMVVGVNGSGKTTSIAKLCKRYRDQGRKIVLAAADTFRAAAIDQLQIWGERLGVDVIAGRPGIDPGAVAHDAVLAAFARSADLLVVDTAGRLHTKHNLMQELVKIRNVLQRAVHEAPHQTLIVIDATNGQNAIAQAKGFAAAVGVTGAILTKLDGTPKGGVAFSIVSELGIPIHYIGAGEALGDLEVFDANAFVENLFES